MGGWISFSARRRVGRGLYVELWRPLTNKRLYMHPPPYSRYVYLAVDASSAMREMDLKPDRLRHVLKVGCGGSFRGKDFEGQLYL